MTQELSPINIQLFQRRRFPFPVDINFGWPRKYGTLPYQYKYWNILISRFPYHSTCVKFPKINLFLSIQQRTFFSQFRTHFPIHQHNCLNLLFLPNRLGLQNTPTASLQRGNLPNECPGYDTKQSDGEVPAMLELWGFQSTPSLPSLSGSLWPEVIASVRVLSMG